MKQRILFLCLVGILGLQMTIKAETVVFTESREKPIRRVDKLTDEWKQRSFSPKFSGLARPGEYYVFQIGVYDDNKEPIDLAVSDLKSDSGTAPIHCINMSGIGNDGQPMSRKVITMSQKITPLWLGVDFPQDAKGVYKSVCVVTVGGIKRDVPVEITVSGEPLPDHGDSIAKNLTRLRWLDSKAGEGDDVLPPYLPVKAEGNVIQIMGRRLAINAQGLPEKITSTFSNSNSRADAKPREYLAGPMLLKIAANDQAGLPWKLGAIEVRGNEALWSAACENTAMKCEVKGRLDYTGSGEFCITLTAKQQLTISGLSLNTPVKADAAKYIIGLSGYKDPIKRGGLLDRDIEWKWNVAKMGQDSLWLGDVNVGLAMRLKDNNYHRQLTNVYYKWWPLTEPVWSNDGKGGWNVKRDKDRVDSVAYTGDFSMTSGESREYIAEFYVTPFHTIDTDSQWKWRFYQNGTGKTPEEMHDYVDGRVASQTKDNLPGINPSGPNIYNAHHAGISNPFINYPMADENIDVLKDFVSRVHAKGGAARLYYTTREQSANTPELFALHSLQGEVILPNRDHETRGELNKTVPEWLQQNLGEEFVAAWTADLPPVYQRKDPSVLTVPDGRWDNFYLAGLEWLVRNVGIDGVYLDDTALNARSLQRARRIMMQGGSRGPFVDFHSWDSNHGWSLYCPNMLMYMELIPYIDHFWMGEGYNASGMQPDEWLVIASGWPFGIMSEMLDGPNPWKGLVFGEVARRDQRNAVSVWQAFDKYGMSGTELVMFNDPDNPFHTGDDRVLATVFKKAGRSFVAIASWNDRKVSITPQVDWAALGLDPDKVSLYAPAMPGIQKERVWKPGDKIDVASGRGYFLVLDEEKREVATANDETTTDKLRVVREENFAASVLPQEWIISEQKGRATLQHTKGQVTLKAPANNYVGMHLALPAGVSALQAVLNPGSDKGQDWGIGLALVWSNQKSVRMNMRMGDNKFGVYAPGKFEFFPGLNKNGDNAIRIVLTDTEFVFQYQSDDGQWESLVSYPRGDGMDGDPAEVRVGKANRSGDWENYSDAGGIGECVIKNVTLLGR